MYELEVESVDLDPDPVGFGTLWSGRILIRAVLFVPSPDPYLDLTFSTRKTL